MLRYHVARAFWRVVQLGLANLIVVGRDHIPTEGPYLVTVNHMSVADTPLLFVAFPTVPWRFFAGENWQDHWLWGPFMGGLGAIYIHREEVDRRAIQEALAAVEEGGVFGLAPEGTRSKVGAMQPAKAGAAYLASRSQVPILPVGVVNSDVLFANVRRLRRTNVQVIIGEPYYLPDLGRRARSTDLEAYTHLIMIHIAALLPERYHGVYAGSPALAALQAGEDPWPYCVEVVRREKEKGTRGSVGDAP
jgi:1-acyl-sn-glycerol-3-phosphate acyltransferase